MRYNIYDNRGFWLQSCHSLEAALSNARECDTISVTNGVEVVAKLLFAGEDWYCERYYDLSTEDLVVLLQAQDYYYTEEMLELFSRALQRGFQPNERTPLIYKGDLNLRMIQEAVKYMGYELI